MAAVTVPAAAGGDQLAQERRLRPRYAVVAALAGLLLLIAAIIQSIGPHTSVQEATLALITENKRSGLDILAGFIEAFGSLAVAGTLVFLFDLSRARNQKLATAMRITAMLGGVLAAIYAIGYPLVFTQKAHQFVSSGTQTYAEAHQLTGSGVLVVLPLLGLVGALLVAMSIALISMQAMRVGLLTRFMGYLGMFAGALVIFQFTPIPVVETYWFVALAVLFLGRWPSGQPRAWSSGRAEPWPSAQELREQRIRAAGPRGAPTGPRPGGLLARLIPQPSAAPPAKGRARKGNSSNGASAPAAKGEVVAPAGGTATRSTAKRKRKRRH